MCSPCQDLSSTVHQDSQSNICSKTGSEVRLKLKFHVGNLELQGYCTVKDLAQKKKEYWKLAYN